MKSKCLNDRTFSVDLLLRERVKEQRSAVRTSFPFGHLIFDIDLTLGFCDLTFHGISKEIFCPLLSQKFFVRY